MVNSKPQVGGNEGLTIVTRSMKPFDREVPSGASYVNHVSVWDYQPEEFAKQTLLALDKVETEYFTLVDDDDPMPTGMCAPHERTGILYGTSTNVSPFGSRVVVNDDWSPHKQIHQYTTYHKPMFATWAYQLVRSHLPPTRLAELTISYYMGSLFGVSHDPDYKPIWVIHKGGMHGRIGGYNETVKWLHCNGPTHVEEIRCKLGLDKQVF